LLSSPDPRGPLLIVVQSSSRATSAMRTDALLGTVRLGRAGFMVHNVKSVVAKEMHTPVPIETILARNRDRE
jgi:hypothetical protein